MKASRCLAVLAAVFFSMSVFAQSTLYSCENSSDLLRTVNPATAATIDSIAMTVQGGSVIGCTGLATQPTTNTLYAIVRLEGDDVSDDLPNRALATVNAATGVASIVGALSTGYAGLAFSCDTLYGVTGDGANPSETLFSLSTVDASETQVLALGAGDDGEAIGFSPADGLLYHASGHTEECAGDDDGVCFESIDLGSLVVTPIDISAGALIDEEAQALTWSSGDNAFLWKQDHDSDAPLFRVATDGSETLIGDMDHQSKGMAFVPANYQPACEALPQAPGIPIPSGNLPGRLLLVVLLGLLGGFIIRRRLLH